MSEGLRRVRKRDIDGGHSWGHFKVVPPQPWISVTSSYECFDRWKSFHSSLFYKIGTIVWFLRPQGKITEEINTNPLAKYLAHCKYSNIVAANYYYYYW